MAFPRQVRRRSPTGVGVDANGGPVIDPTENVLSLVDVEKEHARALREADNRYHNDMRAKDNQRNAELSALRDAYEIRLDEIKSTAVKTTSDLIAVQLDKATTSLSSEIDRMNSANGIRVSELEKFRYETAGRVLGRTELFAWMIAAATLAATVTSLVLKHS